VLAERVKKYPGLLACIYIAGYSVGRLIIEPMRTDSLLAFGIPAAILTSSIMLAVALIMAAIVLNTERNKPVESQE